MADLASFEYQFNRRNTVPLGVSVSVDEVRHPFDVPGAAVQAPDPASVNRMHNMRKADNGDEEAAFAIYEIPEYRRLFESAVRRGDRQAASSLQDKMMTFVNDHRDGLRKWTGLRNNGEWGKAVSDGVLSVLDESYLDKWGQQVADASGRAVGLRSVGAFLQDTSPEAREEDAKMYASRNGGMDLKLARMLTDPDAPGHSVFAGDKALLDDFAVRGDRSPGASESRLAREWTKTKYDMYSKYAGGFRDEQDAGSFFSSWENRFGFAKNGGRDVLDSALAEYQSQSGMSAADFVNLYAMRVEALKEPPVNVSRKAEDGSTQTYQVPQGPEESGKAMGIGNALLRKASEYGVGADVILRNGSLWGSAAKIRKELAGYSDVFGIKVYDTDAEINSHAAETAMYEAGIPGATDRLGFFRDAKASLESALISTEQDRGVVASVGPDGKPQVKEIAVPPAFTDPLERPLLKAVGRAMSGLRTGEQSWASLLSDVASDPSKRARVVGEMANSVLVTSNAEVRNRLAEAAFDGVVTGKKVDFSEVLRGMWTVPDGSGGSVTAKADELRRSGLLLGQTAVDPTGKPVSLDASNGYFAAALRADPEKVMPMKDGEASGVKEAFRKVGDALSSAEPRENASRESIGLLPEAEPVASGAWKSYVKGLSGMKRLGFDNGKLNSAARDLVSKGDEVNDGEVMQLAFVYSNLPHGITIDDPMAYGGSPSFLGFLGTSKPDDATDRGVRALLASHGFFPNGVNKDIDVPAGVRFMEARNPGLRAKSPTRALLFNDDGSARDPKNLGVAEMLAQQQRERVNATDLAKTSEPVTETPEMKEARRLSETFGKDVLGARGTKRLWDWCQRESLGDPSAAAQMFAVKSAQYQALRHRSEADAAVFVDEQDRYEMRYFPKLDDRGVVPGQVERSERPMTQEEFDEYVTRLNGDMAKRNLRPLTKAEWDRYNAEGRVIFKRLKERGEKRADDYQRMLDAAQIKEEHSSGS